MAWNWENKAVGAMYYSRFIASWLHVINRRKIPYNRYDFEDWLRSTGELTEEQISEIIEMANCGRLEAQLSIERFLDEKAKKQNKQKKKK